MDTTSIVNGILAQDQREQEALRLLLDKKLNMSHLIPVQYGNMGENASYMGVVTLQWFAENVKFAHMLPLFKSKVPDNQTNITIDESTIEEIKQRPLDWSRHVSLAAYLAGRRYHKFPSVTVVITKAWVDDPKAKEWGPDGRALYSAADFIPLDTKGRFGLLDLSEENFLYALDGQHRLMGCKGLMDLINKGYITIHKKDSKPDGTILLSDFAEIYGVNENTIQNIANEKIGIEIISAVIKGETREEARRRIRSVFVHINKMASPLTKGQLAQLDEDDGFAIIARKIATTNTFLKSKPNRDDRVNWDNPTIAQKSVVLTTLQTLKEMASWYLRFDSHFSKWLPKNTNLIPLRPEEPEIDKGVQKMEVLMNYMFKLPSLEELERGAKTPDYRRFQSEDPPGKGHMLFRPIGQVALAQAVGCLTMQYNMTLDDIFKLLKDYDLKGGFALDSVQSPWWGVLYDPLKRRMSVAGRDLAARILVYLVSGNPSSPEERESLRSELAKARTIEDETYALDGSKVTMDKFKLPLIL